MVREGTLFINIMDGVYRFFDGLNSFIQCCDTIMLTFISSKEGKIG